VNAVVDALRLISLHHESLYARDGAGCIVAIRDGSGDPPPRFALTRSAAGNTWLVAADVGEDVADRLASLAAAEPPGDEAWPEHDRSYRAIVGAAATEVVAGPAYVLPERLPDPAPAVELVREHLDALRVHFPVTAAEFEERRPVVGIIEGDVVAARCCSARALSEGTEAGVDTAPAHRRRGHAVATTAGWARAVRRLGRIPLYSTTWDNAASQRVAARLGAIRYAVDYTIG
jgi:hypothetical protein